MILSLLVETSYQDISTLEFYYQKKLKNIFQNGQLVSLDMHKLQNTDVNIFMFYDEEFNDVKHKCE